MKKSSTLGRTISESVFAAKNHVVDAGTTATAVIAKIAASGAKCVSKIVTVPVRKISDVLQRTSRVKGSATEVEEYVIVEDMPDATKLCYLNVLVWLTYFNDRQIDEREVCEIQVLMTQLRCNTELRQAVRANINSPGSLNAEAQITQMLALTPSGTQVALRCSLVKDAIRLHRATSAGDAREQMGIHHLAGLLDIDDEKVAFIEEACAQDEKILDERLPAQRQIARELAVGKLREIELVLQDADDIEAMEVVQHAIRDLQGDLKPRDRSNAWQVAGDGFRQAVSAVGSSFQAAGTAVRAGAARAPENLADAMAAVGNKAGEFVGRGASGLAVGFGVAHEALERSLEHLDWSTINPGKYLYAGTRGISRGMEEARLVWESLPERLRALGPEEVSKRLDGFDWSHIVPHGQGGGNEASNGTFELASLNRSRGAERMTTAEVQAAQQVLSEQAFQAVLLETASQVFTGAVAGAAVGCVLASLEQGLEYQRGNITRDEMFQRIGRGVVWNAGFGAAVSGVMAIVALAFPALIPLAAPLMIPLAVLGFCAVGGKIIHFGKEWHELLKGIDARPRLGVVPVALPPTPELAGSE